MVINGLAVFIGSMNYFFFGLHWGAECYSGFYF